MSLFHSLAFAISALTSLFSFSSSGVFRYRSTRYPASISIASLPASLSSLPLWLLSSSSMIAITSKLRFIKTKSAIFCVKLYRLAPPLACSSAPKLTCVSTASSGKHATKRQNIGCSFAVARRFFTKLPFLFFPFVFGISSAATTATVASAPIVQYSAVGTCTAAISSPEFGLLVFSCALLASAVMHFVLLPLQRAVVAYFTAC